ncbi:hypothetical protein NA57DRAFT_75605 [Rhizodiscina lignyota]|uniref:Uncharacterized protein n=1 Tax=Rhizodiscina lignyota TaxID=1504668 RepID=A0A9P4IIV9_9PEZI|nr:hypothetical protein NA57DRAFT_75605 [Rhizodiscina lignyota]
MLPPISPQVLEQNPRFKSLYNDLKASRLTDDGSSKLIKKQRAQEELKKKLQSSRTEFAKTVILQDGLDKLGSRSSELPPELRQVIQVVCAQLDGSLSAADREVLVEDFEYFVEHIEQVSEALSTYLTQSAQGVAALIAATDNPSPQRQLAISLLASKAVALRNTLTLQTSNIANKTIQIADLAASISLINRDILQVTVRILEQSMHGSVSRATRAKAEHLATVARGMELKLSIITHAAGSADGASGGGSDGVGRALKAYGAHLRRLKDDLNAEERALETKLKDYENAGGGMKDIAKRYAELMTETAEVKEEIARLQEAD